MTELTGTQIAALLGPLNGNRVAKRSQGNRSLSYLEAWDVRATLIRVFGFANWSADVTESKVLDVKRTPQTEERQGKTNEYERIEVCAMVTVQLSIHATNATYTESAAASQVGRDIGEVTDFALKTAASDALKRCAMNLGTQFGLSLYDDGALNDVVKVILDPQQRAAYVEAAKEAAAARAVTAENQAAIAEADAAASAAEASQESSATS